MQLGAIHHIPLRPLNIDVWHKHDCRFGKGEWYPTFFRGWYDMWRDRAQSNLDLDMAVGGVLPSRQYLLWYYQWAHMTLIGRGDPSMPAQAMVPDYALHEIPDAPDMVQPEDGELPRVHLRVTRRRRAPSGRGRGQAAPAGSLAREEEPQQGVHTDTSPDFAFGMTDADFLSLGLAGPFHPTADTQADTSYSQPPMIQLQIEAPQTWLPEHYASPQGTPTQPTEPFAHMPDSVPPSAYEPRHMEVEESDDSGDRHMVRGDIASGLDRDRTEIRPPPCGTGGCLDAGAGRRGRGCRRP
ncbi:hypothetical protein PIB30_058713 [Stylosanthes scabra]|uniref:Aminotransferase-like plant mobile domain-containing protein n=1 Tax=Stylosanthes scabra TaxID=79078 RepID=A0ABU6QKN0_9FABA|nr:hypothetical protein [Stylosanthes scabra]